MKRPAFAATIVDPEAGQRFKQIAKDYTFWAFANPNPIRSLKPAAVERLNEIGVPTLIVTAEKDIPACLEIAHQMNQSVENSRMVVMKGTGHLLHMEKPREFNKTLRDFLASVNSPRRDRFEDPEVLNDQ